MSSPANIAFGIRRCCCCCCTQKTRCLISILIILWNFAERGKYLQHFNKFKGERKIRVGTAKWLLVALWSVGLTTTDRKGFPTLPLFLPSYLPPRSYAFTSAPEQTNLRSCVRTVDCAHQILHINLIFTLYLCKYLITHYVWPVAVGVKCRVR